LGGELKGLMIEGLRSEAESASGGMIDGLIRYAAIGDSYTICEGADEQDRWPNVLTRHLNEHDIAAELVANPSVTGFTTQDLIDKELPVFESCDPNFATLLIGVNDWVQEVEAEQFRSNLSYIMDVMLKRLHGPERLVVITIPDFGVTPEGPKYSRGRDISRGLASFNVIVKEEAANRNLQVVDIFESSKKMAHDPSLVWTDGLHPSPKMYAEWEEMILPVAVKALRK